MRILIYGINYFPELTGIGKYTGELAEWLSTSGHEVRVVTALPYYPEWKIHKGYANWKYTREVGGLRVYRCPLWVPARQSGLKRLLHLMSFAITSLPVMLRHIFWRPDIVWAVEPSLVCAPTAWMVARLSGARCLLHIQDLEVDAAFGLGLVNSNWLQRVALIVERWMLRRFDCLSTISRTMQKRLVDKGIKDSVLFPNWVDTKQINPLQELSTYREQLGISGDKVVVLYSGNMGKKQGLEIISEAAKSLTCLSENLSSSSTDKGQSVLFIFCGAGPGRADLENSCKGLSNVQFLDLQPDNHLNELLNLADIHLLPQKAAAADLVMPSKLTGMLASGRPVIATAKPESDIAKTIEGAGVLVPPDNIPALTQAILDLANDKEKRQLLGRNARVYAVENLDKYKILDRFEKELKGLVSR